MMRGYIKDNIWMRYVGVGNDMIAAIWRKNHLESLFVWYPLFFFKLSNTRNNPNNNTSQTQQKF